jgi:GTP-binding protein YchF
VHLGIVGPAASGKSTLFAAATGLTQDLGHGAHRAVVKVPDDRVAPLAEMAQPKKVTHAEIEYLDYGLAADSAHAADLEAKTPAELRASDALVAVIRAFESDVVAHPKGSIDPERDLEDLRLALILADLATVEKRIERIERTLKVKKDQALATERALLVTCREQLEGEKPLRELEATAEEMKRLKGFEFLSAKPLLVVVNIGEAQIGEAPELETHWRTILPRSRCALIALCAQIEMEIAQLEDAEREVFLADLGIAEPALGRLIRASYDLLGLISFFTVGDPEVRAWTIPSGATALDAADQIHSDIARGFIRAEVVTHPDYVAHGGVAGAKQAGKFRLEGKDYIVRDGDVIYFRFNV